MNDVLESALDSEELEEESEEAVDQILMEIAGETLQQMAAAPRRQKVVRRAHVLAHVGEGAVSGTGAGKNCGFPSKGIHCIVEKRGQGRMPPVTRVAAYSIAPHIVTGTTCMAC